MPIYEYQCDDCGHRGEELQKMGARPLRKCPECGGKYTKQVSAPAFQFKGTGWYVTDYARKDKGGDSEGGKAKSSSDSSESTDSKSDSGKKDKPKKDTSKSGSATKKKETKAS